MSQDTKRVAIFSADNGLERVIETNVVQWAQAKIGTFMYRAQLGLSEVIVWKTSDCPDVELPEGTDADFILTVY